MLVKESMWNLLSLVRGNQESPTESSESYGVLADEWQNDIHLSDDTIKSVHDRIRHCLDEDYEEAGMDDGFGRYKEVDDTLKLMREETEKWCNPGLRALNDNREPNDALYRDMEAELLENKPVEDTQSNELLAYCLRLERNNAYLLYLVEKFEQVSFKKRYSDLLVANEKLQKEYSRLKSTNTKVYMSYCDLIEEIKRIKLENKSIKNRMNEDIQKSGQSVMEQNRLTDQMEKLKKENADNAEKLRTLRKNNVSLQRKIAEKEDELIKLNGVNVATKLKLKKAEALLLKQTMTSQPVDLQRVGSKAGIHLASDNKDHTPELNLDHSQGKKKQDREQDREQDQDFFQIENHDQYQEQEQDQDQDTIAILQRKYQNKIPIV